MTGSVWSVSFENMDLALEMNFFILKPFMFHLFLQGCQINVQQLQAPLFIFSLFFSCLLTRMLKTPAGWICALILLYLTYPGILFLVSICVCNLLWAHFFLLSMHKSYSIKKIQIQRCPVVELLMNSVRTEHPCIFSFLFFFFWSCLLPKMQGLLSEQSLVSQLSNVTICVHLQ